MRVRWANEVTLDKELAKAVAAIKAAKSVAELRLAVRRFRGMAYSLASVTGTYPVGVTMAWTRLFLAFSGTKLEQVKTAWALANGVAPATVLSASALKYTDVPWRPAGPHESEAQIAEACTDYDFTEYDTYGMGPITSNGPWWYADRPKLARAASALEGEWWAVTEDPRMDYCGPGRGGPFVGDEPMLDSQGKQITTEDGGVVYASDRDSGPYVVGGAGFCRYNPKDWVKEEALEICFLIDVNLKSKQAARTGNWQPVIDTQHQFINYKTSMHDQWVTKVPGFYEIGDPANWHGRHKYAITKWRDAPPTLESLGDDPKDLDEFWNRISFTEPARNPNQKVRYLYVPRIPGESRLVNALRENNGNGNWRWGAPGTREGAAAQLAGTYSMGNRPDNVVEPAQNGQCVINAQVREVVAWLKTVWAIYNIGGSGLESMVEKGLGEIIKVLSSWLTTQVVNSVKKEEVSVNFGSLDPTGVYAAYSALMYAEYVSTEAFRGCTAWGEYILWNNFDPGLNVSTVKDAAKGTEIFRKAMASYESIAWDAIPGPVIAAAPTVVKPPTTTTTATPAASSGLTALLAGAAAGFLLGGPAGAGVGAVVAAAVSGKSTSAGTPTTPAAPVPTASAWTGSWDTNLGVLTFQQDGSGIFGTMEFAQGVMAGVVLADGELSVKWAQTGPKQGTIQARLAPDGKSFLGTWKAIPENTTGVLVGTKRS
jgi:hypothetical protein